MRKILITGGSGFIGTNLVDYYKSLGDEVINLDIVAPRNHEHIKQWLKLDLLNSKALVKIVSKINPDLVFHMAARTDIINGASVDDYAVNTKGVKNLIEAIKKINSVQCVIFASSMLVCRIGFSPSSETEYCPSTPYGESKIIGEQLIRKEAAKKFPWVIVRPTSIWGPWFEAPYRDFFTTIQKGFYVHPKGYRIHRSYGFVLNTVFQLDKIIQSKNEDLIGRTIYIADYKPIELKNWANSIQRTLGVRPIREVPLLSFKVAAKFGDFLKTLGYKTPPMSSFRLNNMLTETIHNITPLQDYCGNIPYTMEDGVLITCDWLIDKPALS
jgi:GlcNAc-P-P-Und epimerase